jgi:hypothetical protein
MWANDICFRRKPVAVGYVVSQVTKPGVYTSLRRLFAGIPVKIYKQLNPGGLEVDPGRQTRSCGGRPRITNMILSESFAF